MKKTSKRRNRNKIIRAYGEEYKNTAYKASAYKSKDAYLNKFYDLNKDRFASSQFKNKESFKEVVRQYMGEGHSVETALKKTLKSSRMYKDIDRESFRKLQFEENVKDIFKDTPGLRNKFKDVAGIKRNVKLDFSKFQYEETGEEDTYYFRYNGSDFGIKITKNGDTITTYTYEPYRFDDSFNQIAMFM